MERGYRPRSVRVVAAKQAASAGIENVDFMQVFIGDERVSLRGG
jgi:hypothetical protein